MSSCVVSCSGPNAALLRADREFEANILKSCAESILFLTFLISFILRVLPRVEAYEPLHSQDYGWILVCAFVAFLTLGVGLSWRQVMQHRRFRSDLVAHALRSSGFAETAQKGPLDTTSSPLLTAGSPGSANDDADSGVANGRGRSDRFYAWVAAQ